jgi:heptosyltransferase-2
MSSPSRILIVQPSWVGDVVMATPTLRAIRELYPAAHISYLARRYVKEMLTGLPWADRVLTYRTGKTRSKQGKGTFDLAARLRAGKFDLAILLPNSFKTALVCKMANIPRVFGYDRDGRGFLLTDRLLPVKDKGKFVPAPMIHTYMSLARYLGSASRDIRMELFVTDPERNAAIEVMRRAGISEALDRPAAAGRPPLVMLNPGAQYGAAKLWKPEYFAEIGDRFVTEHNATVLLSSSPREREIITAVRSHMRQPSVDLSAAGMTLGSLKEIIRRCDLMITNDTGPRHIAAALDVPVVSIFGPTDPAWTEIYYPKERQIAVKVFCGPCQKKICPLDHRCMTLATPDLVWAAAMDLLGAKPSSMALPVVA